MNCRDLIDLAAMVYEPLYHAREKATIILSSGLSPKRNQQDLAITTRLVGYLSSHIQRALLEY